MSETAVVKTETAVAVTRSRGQELYGAVMAAARKPDITPQEVKEYLEVAREMKADCDREEFMAAFARVKTNLPTIDKRGTIPDNQGRVRSRFAMHDDLHKTITPILREEGLATSFTFEDAGPDRMTCRMTLTHDAGHSQVYETTGPWAMDIPKASLNQKSRGAQSFMKRNLMIDAFDILAEEQDDDASGQGVPEAITDEQAQTIEAHLEQIEELKPGDRKRFMNWMALNCKTDDIRELRQGAQFEAVMEPLRKKLAEKK